MGDAAQASELLEHVLKEGCCDWHARNVSTVACYATPLHGNGAKRELGALSQIATARTRGTAKSRDRAKWLFSWEFVFRAHAGTAVAILQSTGRRLYVPGGWTEFPLIQNAAGYNS